MTTINTFLEWVKAEMAWWRIVVIHRIGRFYPELIKQRPFYNVNTGETINFYKDTTCMRFEQARTMRLYFRQNFTGIKYKVWK
jgi:nucleoid DNA-binding protein